MRMTPKPVVIGALMLGEACNWSDAARMVSDHFRRPITAAELQHMPGAVETRSAFEIAPPKFQRAA